MKMRETNQIQNKSLKMECFLCFANCQSDRKSDSNRGAGAKLGGSKLLLRKRWSCLLRHA